MKDFTFYIERDYDPQGQREFALEVTYTINRFRPATHLQPEEGGDCEIISVLHEGEEFDLTQAEEDELKMACENDAAENPHTPENDRAEMWNDFS